MHHKGIPSQPEFTKVLQNISFGTDSETVSLEHLKVKIALLHYWLSATYSFKNSGFSTHG